MPQAVVLTLTAIQALISAAPKIESIVKSGHDMIDAMFTAQLITKTQQDALHSWVDSHAALVAAGIVAPAWQVEPDPQ